MDAVFLNVMGCMLRGCVYGSAFLTASFKKDILSLWRGLGRVGRTYGFASKPVLTLCNIKNMVRGARGRRGDIFL